jgi:hypothetical protein
MKNSRQVWVTGFLASLAYLICAMVAFFNYPLTYSPLANWLSDLGNPIINPIGAFSYNLGCVLAGLCLIFFTLGLEIWDDGDKKRRILLTITQVTGIISSLSLIVSAFFPLGAQTLIHSISGKAHIFFAGFFLTFSATIILTRPNMPKWLAYFGFFVALINFIYGAFLHSVFIAEWAAIGLFIIYILMVAINSLKQNLPRADIGISKGS